MSSSEYELISQLRARVALLERQVDFLLRRLGLDYVDETAPGIHPDVLAAVRRGNKIEAIKLYRELTGADLRTAKEVIESLE